MIVTTYTWTNKSLALNWKWLRTGSAPDGHNIRCIDVDGDGKDEIIPFGFCLKPNGTLLYTLGNSGIVHGDRFHTGDLDPSRPGLECYVIQQDNPSGLAWAYYDAKTGDVIHKQVLSSVNDLARGCAGDFDPGTPGFEFWTFTDGIYNVSGKRVSNVLPSSYPNLRIWWDGDLLSENLDNNKMTKWNFTNSSETRLYMFKDNSQWERNVPGFYGDILGDWREEIVYSSGDGNSLLIFLTTAPTTERLYTLPHNPGYRNCLNSRGYYQSNMADFYLGDGMGVPPEPRISIVNGGSTHTAYTVKNETLQNHVTLSGTTIRMTNITTPVTVYIHDLSGKLVYRGQYCGTTTLSCPSLSRDRCYIVQVKSDIGEILLNKRLIGDPQFQYALPEA
jgi:hypothetical protein